MSFASDISIKNIKRKPFRSLLLFSLVLLIAFTLFSGAFVIISLRNGLVCYQSRLGADIVVIPSSAKGHGSVDDILLSGITGNYYMSGKDFEKVASTEGIASITRQFFLTSAKASCCSARVQIIGFDPKTDFSIQPWISESYKNEIEDGDVVVGCNINGYDSGLITFYGQEYRIAARLEKTGTGLDNAIYTNMATVRQMAKNADRLLETSPFQGVDIETATSAVLIKVAEGYTIEEVADDINIHITKVEAKMAKSMISDISEGLLGTSRMIGILVALIWALALIILIIVFVLLSNERRKEFAILRVMGASQKMLSRIMGTEGAILCAAGAAAGIVLSLLIIYPLSASIKDMLGLPFLSPGIPVILLLALLSFALSLFAGMITALICARRITKNETGLLLREDA